LIDSVRYYGKLRPKKRKKKHLHAMPYFGIFGSGNSLGFLRLAGRTLKLCRQRMFFPK
jgi:hypothetical protein